MDKNYLNIGLALSLTFFILAAYYTVNDSAVEKKDILLFITVLIGLVSYIYYYLWTKYKSKVDKQ